MNQINNNKNYIFFFYIDSIKEFETDYLKINNFFYTSEKLCHNKYFSIFLTNYINFNFLEKNEKLISFFLFMNKFFFKNQIKNLKLYLLNECVSDNKINKSKKNIPFFLNFFYFFRYFYFFVFLLKKISFKNFSNQ